MNLNCFEVLSFEGISCRDVCLLNTEKKVGTELVLLKAQKLFFLNKT